MRAIVIEKAGGPEALEIKEVPTPKPGPGQVLVRVKAAGLNHSEAVTRKGYSPSVKFPRVLGVECVGVVEEAPGGDLQKGQTVAAVMGGMGRAFDGSYAEFTCVPATQVLPLNTKLDWATLGALPETFLTAHRILRDGLEVKTAASLVVRGGTSSIGMALITMAKEWHLPVIATTRNLSKAAALQANGADHVLIDAGKIQEEVHRLFPGGAWNCVDLVGCNTLHDSLRCVRPKGYCCMAGHLSGQWEMEKIEPIPFIPYSVRFTTINTHGVSRATDGAALQSIVERVEAGALRPCLHKTFKFSEIHAAHRYMDESRAAGKVVLVME